MIIHSYDPLTRPIISPGDFYPAGRFGSVCLILFSVQLYRILLEQSECRQVGFIGACNGRKPIWKTEYEGRTLLFYLSAVGSCGAGTDLTEVAHQTGARRFVMFGSAGDLDPAATAGRFVLPSSAYRDEGMSYHYAPPADYIEVPGHRFLARLFDEWRIPYVTGPVWTTDAVYRETAGQLKARREEGCLAVEMEVAGVQAVCDFYGYELFDFLQTGDVLSEDEYDPSGLHGANHDRPKLFLALRIARELAERDED